LLEPCANVDCTSRATETAFILAYGLEVSVRVCARDAEVIGFTRRSLRDAQERATRAVAAREQPLAIAPASPRRLQAVRALPSSET
jgi:hypothetical protein